MSKLSRKPINFGAEFKLLQQGDLLLISRGSAISEIRLHKSILVNITGESCSIALQDGAKDKSHLGTFSSLLRNRISDMLDPFKLVILLSGVGFKAFVSTDCIVFSIGYSHFISIAVPSGLTVTVGDVTKINITGLREAVTLFASRLQSLKEYDPYKGKGILIEGRFLRRKSGKKKS